jgi:hypothetical protein
VEHGHGLLIQALEQLRPEWLTRGGITVLEVGSSREPLPNQDSTRILARFCQERDWRFTTCDMDPENTARAAKLFADMGVDFAAVTALGEEYIAGKRKAFDVVYLDAYDFDHGKHSEQRQQRYEEFLGSRIDQHACEVMHLKAMQGLNRAGRRRCLVVIDDTWRESPDGPWLGKGPLAVPWALRNGWSIALETSEHRAVALQLDPLLRAPHRHLARLLRGAWQRVHPTDDTGASGQGLGAPAIGQDAEPAGDESDADVLQRQYAKVVDRLALPETVNVLEIGAAEGSSTEALRQALGERLGSYQVLEGADIAAVEDRSLDLVLAQSSWSRLSLYDQYRYLRDLRDKLKHRAPVFVNGLFVLGAGDGWTWNRFRRRMHQVEHDIPGDYHEFTSISTLTEMLARLGYEDITIFSHGFLARRGGLVLDQYHAQLPRGMDFQYRSSLDDWLSSGTAVPGHLPPVRVTAAPSSSRLSRARGSLREQGGKLKRRLR